MSIFDTQATTSAPLFVKRIFVKHRLYVCCLWPLPPIPLVLLTKLVKVVVGEHDKTEGQHQGEHAVSAILPHPAYTAAPPYPHDAALLTLAAPLTFSARVAPVCLPAAASLYAGRVATVTGWGSTLVLGATSAVLREANVTIMANEECGEAFSDSFDSPWIKKYFAKTLISSFIYAFNCSETLPHPECCHASPFFITHAHAHENEERLQRKVGEAEWEAIVWKSMTKSPDELDGQSWDCQQH